MHEKNNSLNNNLLTIVLHDIQSPLRFIGTIMQDLSENCMVMDKETLQEHVNMLHNSIISLQHYCDKIKDWENSKTELTALNEQININEIFIDIKEIYSPLIAAKKINFNVIETDINCNISKGIIFIILINLIDNAYKNTNTGIITLEALMITNGISFIISDTGNGMDQEKINDVLADKPRLTHSSLGYFIIKDLLKKINGTIMIKSEINSGTQVFINLLNPEKYGSACLSL